MPVHVKVKLEQVDVPMELDTGPTVTVISEATLAKLEETTPQR